jgi:hypothetical protein
LASALNPVATSTELGTVTVAWEDNSAEGNANPYDKTLIVVFNENKGEAVYQIQQADRVSASQNITVPNAFAGDTVHCYIAFISLDGTLLSNSKYAGSVVVYD